MTRCGVRPPRSPSGRRQPRPGQCRLVLRVRPMVPPNPVPSPTAASAAATPIGIWRLLAVAAPHLGARLVMLQTETDFTLAPRVSAGMGHPEFLLYRAAPPSGAVRRAVADAGGDPGAAVAAQARHRADDRQLRRPDGDRPRHRRVPVYDLSQSALVGDRLRHAAGAAADVRAAGAGWIRSGSGACRPLLARWPVSRRWSESRLLGPTKPGAATTTTAICRNSPAPASPRFPISSITVLRGSDRRGRRGRLRRSARWIPLPSGRAAARHHHDPRRGPGFRHPPGGRH